MSEERAKQTSDERPPTEEAEEGTPGGVSSWAIAYRQLKRDRVAMFAFFSLVALGLTAVLSPLLANSKPIVARYQGTTYFPAFKDYLDENFPWPPALTRTLRTWSFFSPKYPTIERPDWQLLPDWHELRRRIDEDPSQGWYVLPPVPYYYSEDSSAIKLKDGWYTVELELPGEEEALEFVPKRPPAEEWSRIRAHLPEGASTRAQIVFDPERKVWLLEDALTVEVPAPDDWITFLPDDAAGTVMAALRSRDAEPATIVASWEPRARYLRRGQELATHAEAASSLASRWAARHDAALDLERPAEWIAPPGVEVPALEVREQADEDTGMTRVAWVLFGPTRVWTVRLTAPSERRPGARDSRSLEQLAQDVLPTLVVGVPSGTTRKNGEVVEGAVALKTGDEVDLSGVTGKVRLNRPYYLGTDGQGRCVLSRLIHGTVIAGAVGLCSVGLYVLIGVVLGAFAGYFRGWVDLVISRVIEVVICFPTLFLIIMIVGFWQKQSIWLIMIALGLLNWTGVARLVRGEFLKVMSEDFVHAARALGLPTGRIIFRHVLPNAIAPVFVSASFGVAGAILVETSLSFLGFGVAPPTASWGEILKQGKEYVNEDVPHLIWYPGFAIFFTVTMFNLLGEGLRDALDPKLRR